MKRPIDQPKSRPKNKIAILVLLLLALCTVAAHDGFADNTGYAACHHGLDADRGKAAAISDATKKAQAYDHLKAAYADEKANSFTDCLNELKAAEALMQ